MEYLIDILSFSAYCLLFYTVSRLEEDSALLWLIITGNYE